MKAIFKSAIALMAACTFAACSDVPMPYDDPNSGQDSEDTTGVYLNETFESSFGKFSPYTVKGTPWVIDYSTAKATGYDNTAKQTIASEGYLVSSAVDLSSSKAAYLQFDYILRYVTAGMTENKVLIADAYTGDPTTTTWTDITGTLTEGSDWTTFSTYKKNIPAAFIGKKTVVVALMYSCTTSSSTIEVKNLVLKEGTVDETGGDTPTPSGDLNTAETAWAVAEALQKISDNGGNALSGQAYVKGIISSVDYYNETYKSISYYISDDGTSANALQIYSGKGLNGADFGAKTDLKVGQTVVVKGTLKAYNGQSEMDKSSTIVSISGDGDEPAATGLNATFASGDEGFTIKDISLSDGLTYVWKYDATNHYMKASAYVNSTNRPAQSMIISPAFSLAGLTAATLTFDQTAKYLTNAADELQALASTDGVNWTPLTLSAYPDGSSWNFVTTTADMSAFAGEKTVYVAFQYTSTSTSAPTWEVKNVTVK